MGFLQEETLSWYETIHLNMYFMLTNVTRTFTCVIPAAETLLTLHHIITIIFFLRYHLQDQFCYKNNTNFNIQLWILLDPTLDANRCWPMSKLLEWLPNHWVCVLCCRNCTTPVYFAFIKWIIPTLLMCSQLAIKYILVWLKFQNSDIYHHMTLAWPKDCIAVML